MKARLAAPATGSPAPRAAGPATIPRLASVIGNRATCERVAGTTELRRPSLPLAARVQPKFSTGRAEGGPASHPARAHSSGLGAAAVHASAARGVATSWSALPHGDAIQRAFGRHDISSVQAHTGSDAAASARAMGAEAYAMGNHVVLGDGATDLHTVAHEAAHVVQQRAGVQLKGGVGEAGDPYERHADEVADRVVQGKSAESLLDAMGPARGAAPAGSVQHTRKRPRRTERRVLDQMASDDGSLRADHSDALVDKMGKGQTFERARAIAAQIEAESERLVSTLPAEDQDAVRDAIRDYVSSSLAIQNEARGKPDAPNLAVQALDAALAMIRDPIATTVTDRIVYRSVSYPAVTDIPYGRATTAGHVINVGDLVSDRGFLSTSEHRQFVIGKEQTGKVDALLQLVIHGRSGVPVAIDFPRGYSNSNSQRLYDMQQSRKNRLTRVWNKVFGAGPRAGQAEVLFPRNTVFEVKQIERGRTTVSVVLEEVTEPHAVVKNVKDGVRL